MGSSAISGGTGTFTQVDITAEGDLRLQDNSGGQYVGIDAPSSVSSSYTLTMPSAVGSVNQVLSLSNTDGTLAWSTPEVGDITAVTAGDGLSGGGTSGAVSLALDLNELTAATVNVANDSIAIVDASDSNTSRKETIADLMSAVDGTGLTASSGVLSVDASQTQITAVGALGAGSIASGFTSISTSYTDAKVTSVVAGTLVDVSGTTGAVTVNVDLSELATSTSDGDGDFFAVVDASNAQKKLTKGNIDLAGFGGTAATATLASTITVTANNATSETVYPLFVDGATGTQGAESDTGLNYNPSSGILTTTQVTGNLLGDVTGNVSGSSGSTTGNAATATVSSTSVVVDSSDASAFPAFFDSATGSLAIKTDASGLTYNATTGVLSAGFAGALTGNVTGNVSGTSATVTGASQSNITSVGTLTSLAISGDATVGDDLSLISDAAVLNFGENSDVSLTHVHDIGLLLNSSMQLQFGDNQSYIQQSGDGTLRINGEGVLDLYGSSMIAMSNDVRLNSDASVLGFGVDNDVTLTHVHDTGLLLNSTMAIQFNDASQYINAPTATVLDINATDEIELNATTIDINGTLDVSGAVQAGSTITVGVDDAGHDVKFFGNTASAYMLWDTSDDDLILGGAAGLVVPDGKLTLASTAVTSTGAELNILDGVTSTTAELNILDGVTSTTAELNILDGVTSTAAELNILDGVTSTTAELNILDGVTSTTAELNILDGATVVVGEINYLDLGATAVGTAIASKAVVLDSNKDYTGIRNLTATTLIGALTGDASGNAATATALETARTIGGTSFNGTANIAVGLAATATALATARTIGGTSFDGTANIAVALATDATTLATPRAINGVDFDGSAPITVTAAAGTLSGGTLASGVTASSLTSVGTLTSLTTSGDIVVGATDKIYLDNGGNTYLVESAGDTISLVAGGTTSVSVTATGTSFNDLAITNVGDISLDSVSSDGSTAPMFYGTASSGATEIGNAVDNAALFIRSKTGTSAGMAIGVTSGGDPYLQGCFADNSGGKSIILNPYGDNVVVTGSLSKGGGSFLIPHPLPSMNDTHNLVHSFVEGPRADLIYRDSVTLSGGAASVDLDEVVGMTDGTWELLCRDPQVFLQNDTSWAALNGSVSGSTLIVNCEDTNSTDTISWMVVAERQDDFMKASGTDFADSDGRPILEPLKRQGTSHEFHGDPHPSCTQCEGSQCYNGSISRSIRCWRWLCIGFRGLCESPTGSIRTTGTDDRGRRHNPKAGERIGNCSR